MWLPIWLKHVICSRVPNVEKTHQYSWCRNCQNYLWEVGQNFRPFYYQQTNKWLFKHELKFGLAPLWNATAWWKLLEWCHVCDRTLVWWCHCNSRCELWIENLQIVWPLPPSMCIVVLSKKNNSAFWISSKLLVLHWNCQDTPKNKCLFRDCFGGRMIWSII